MSDCANVKTCAFFNNKNVKEYSFVVDAIKEYYCRDSSKKCARYTVSLAVGKENVPLDLFPNEKYRVNEIINECF